MATYITLVLDKSGSMNDGDSKKVTINAFNSYIEGLNKEVSLEEIFFSLIQFCTNGIEVTHRAVPLKDVPKLNGDTYRPEVGGGTPLIDATMKSIKATEEKAPAGSKVQIVVLTDGYENASKQYKNADLFEMVKKKTEQNWLFTYLSAGIDSFAAAASMGFNRDSTMNYSKRMSDNAFKGVIRSSASYASTGNIGAAAFLVSERLDSIDPNDPILGGQSSGQTTSQPAGGTAPQTTSQSIVDDIDL